ncbi:Bug family tripartite tricarboxylate transporter substrate binding protein [Roseococcus pinisoli]|uniref:Tripartite tricarboxylate transporter substrate binding protein n=1 Tax=Roseococcus pinisoli TaxID=2835040 RepID=A0ABS5QGZ5_9PROT|nr:tripartite tricarboxylate transporter substrate binding protein [Roseococcus pinisoli]MBS7812606.1 tripartite tricarboxylate transporter substrate binding protein [Roseococcus pinisoli]
MISSLRRLLTGLAVLLPLAAPAAASAQSYPDRAIRVVITWAPGGTTDFVARLYAQQLGAALGQSVVVENRTGGSGSIGWNQVVQSRPDGYTLLITDNSIVTVPPLLPDLGFDMRRAMEPVAELVDYPVIFTVPAALPVHNLRELVTMARAQPDALNYGSMGNGSTMHLYMEVFQDLAGMRMTHVPYRGAGPAFMDTIAGRIQLVLAAPATMMSGMQAGQVRAIAVSTPGGPVPAFPGVQTVREAGYDFDLTYWYGLLAPRGLDPAIATRLREAVTRVNADPAVRERFAAQGAAPLSGDGVALGRRIDRELTTWTRLVADKNIRP